MTEVIDREAFFEELNQYLQDIAEQQGFTDHTEFLEGPLLQPEERPRAMGPLTAFPLPVEQYASPNYYTPAQVKDRWGLDRTYTEITIHHWGANGQHFDNVVSWLTDPDAQASSHYVVQGTDADGSKNARVGRLVSETNVAWTNGSRAGNATAITIECRPEATAEDYAVVALLIRDIRSRHGDLPIRPHNVWISTDCPGGWDLIRLDRLARAGARWTCTKVLWRGKYQCAHSIPKLDRLAKTTPNDYYVQLIQGAWSTGTEASKGTHAGGGAGDTKGSDYSWTMMGTVETAGRKVWLLIWRRKYISGLWSQHCHYLDPECPSLSAAAQSQFYLFEDGYDGLVGNNPDTGYRVNADEIIRLFKSRLTVDPAPVVESGGTLEGIMALTAKEEEFAQRVANLSASRTLGRRYPPASDDQPAGASIEAHIFNSNAKSGRNEHTLRRVEAAVAAVQTTLLDEGRAAALADLIASKIPTGVTVTQEMVNEAIRAAFEDAFSSPLAAADLDEDFDFEDIRLQIMEQEARHEHDRHVAFPDD